MMFDAYQTAGNALKMRIIAASYAQNAEPALSAAARSQRSRIPFKSPPGPDSIDREELGYAAFDRS